MVSRVYTPPVTPYNRPQGTGVQRGIPSPTEENPKSSQQQALQQSAQQTTQQAPQKAVQPESGNAQQRSAGLQSVQYDRFQKIPLDAVLHDFRNTMSALGADDNTQAEVAAYLKVVSLQGAKEQPEVSFIKHTLRTAAGTLDQYIGKALGQPSNVVKEWVDALLLQNIDFHSDTPFSETTNTPTSDTPPRSALANTPDSGAAEANPASENALSTQSKNQLKSLIESAKAEQKAGNPDSADAKLQAALDCLQDKNHPEWEGKIWRLRGRFTEQAGNWEKALSHYTQAAERFSHAALPDKQADTLHAMASILEDHGQLEQAQSHYQQVIALEEQHGDSKAQVRALNDLGRINLRLGQTRDAIQHLEKAATLGQTIELPAHATHDILSNLGAAYRKAEKFKDAAATYQSATQAARNAKDKPRYIRSLQQYAAMLVEAGQPAQAMKALQRLKAAEASA